MNQPQIYPPDVFTHSQSAQFFFALGHPRRLRIIDALRSRPKGLTFEHLEMLVSIRGASLSHHLRFLKDADLIKRAVVDRFSIYTFDQTYYDRMMEKAAASKRKSAR